MRVRISAKLIVTAAAAALLACAGSPPPPRVTHEGLLTFVCDTALKRPLRLAEMPEVSTAAGYGSITGVVFRAGTGNGIDSASIILSPYDSATTQSRRVRVTGQTGGFAFDSVVPGRYRLRVIAAWEHPESSLVAIRANHIDTVRFPMQAPGMCTRS